jgi:NitT/TauT family transport system permease protein
MASTPVGRLSRDRAAPRAGLAEKRRSADIWPTLATFATIALAWEGAIRLTNTPAYLIPLPSSIVARTLTDLPSLLPDAAITLGEALGGLLIASVVALGAALLMSRYTFAERALFPLAVAVKVTPMVAVAPLLVIWLGFGPAPKLIVAALLSYFPILSNALTGLRSVNPHGLEFLRSLDASPREILLNLRLPHALPFLFSAYKVSTTLSVIGAVVAEWVGADRGLGHAIILANANFDMTGLASGVLVLAVLGIGLYLVVATLERQLLFWHESVLTTEVYR